MDDFITLFSFSICNTVKRFLMSIRHKMPLIPCDTIVARAAPATSSFKIIIQNIWYHVGLISSIHKDLKNEKYDLAYLHRAFLFY